MTKPQPWKILASETAFQHRWYHLRRDTVQLPNGQVIDDYFVSVRPAGALVFPVTAQGEVIFVRQYKHAAGKILLELPGGMFDADTEDPGEAAARELYEETGYSVTSISPLGTLYDNPTKDTSVVHLFLAEGAALTGQPSWDETECVEVIPIPLAEVLPKLMSGEIKVSCSVSLCFMALQVLQQRVSL
ncbi:NUDIX domain-containing protein [Nibribacter ruber]|uniref:GDP-mannose pyrophosphatase n=1 Tax=Nibribacter ruber TaxID=2698458 RepID=A0A6P1NZF2_9BACT|nr:NUDIX hydrolase [Nibribacter ruber]QHL87368.1 NUDIX domain-containing protein [Nibribacter ruber]